MVEQQIVRMAVIHQLAKVAGQRLEAGVGGFDEDLGVVASRAQDPLNAEHLMADRIAVAERREHLMDADHARIRS